MNRRQFIEKGSRWSLLGGLIGIGGFLVARDQIGDPDNCFKNPLCKSCSQFSSCDVITALKGKKHE